ncbi:terminal uridylyltransferase 7 isoform 2 [Cricetulus griseus]|uniref:RNA uridylyltransferase n=1 Tax=Cricetulus griseus TaxID=10029 RepID=A0A061IC33_CRIGR|nr:terminal uridylyltransferase 7 isoform 2 [Cricetulus griseus]
MDDYAKGHGSKMEKGLPKKKIAPGNYGNTPRKGPYAASSNPYAFKNPIYSQPTWMNDNHKDQNKRWLPDELTENKKQRSRPRKPRRPRNEEGEQDGELEGPVIDESALSAKELLGLHQAEERLKRDCIDRLKRMSQPDVLLLVQECLKNSDAFTDVDADFHARVPVVVCRDKQSGLLCKVSAGNENACLTTKHLTALGKLEPRLVPLVIAFRYWAKLCSIDRPEEGGLPPYVFALMAVFFLQQREEPLLPVYLGSWIEEFSLNKLGNFSLKDVEKDSVIWEYTDDTTGGTSTAKEEAPKEAAAKKGQVPLTFNVKHQPSVPVGQLWVELLRFYALEFNLADLVISIRVKELISRESKDWPKKRIAIEDPYSVKRNVARTLNNQPVFEYILHCLRTTYKYFALPHRVTKPNLTKPTSSITHVSDPYKEARSCGPKLQTTDTDKLGKAAEAQGPGVPTSGDCKAQPLTLKNTTEQLGSPPEEEIGSVHIQIHRESSGCVQAEVICEGCEGAAAQHQETGNDKEKAGRKVGHLLSTDDQGLSSSQQPELESCGSLCGLQADNTLELVGLRNPGAEECDNYFSLDDKADVNKGNTEGADEMEASLNCFSPLVPGQASAAMHFDDDEDEEEEEGEEPRLSVNHTEDEEGVDREHQRDNGHSGSGEEDAVSEEDDLAEPAGEDVEECGEHMGGTLLVGLNRISLHEESFPEEENSPRGQSDFFYEFRKLTFTKGKSPTVVCSLCKREGHLKKDCPEDFKRIQLEPLPPLTPKFSSILDQVCIQCYKDFSPTLIEDQAREHIRQNLESFIKQDFPGTKLSLFGSSKNGFGFKQSDLDVCMTINGHETAEGLDCVRTIEELARALRKHSGLRNILPITTAKVPIVKFFHLRSGLEVDISLYNTLALHNTRLLSAYSAIDPRVKYLCYTMKVFTKMCDIGDASRGSLSSYAYTLMVLYFLQQRSPPVIPVLQEIYRGEKKPEILVDGWNIYFFDQIDELPAYWPEYGRNTESVGQLWLGLLRFYTEEFDFKEHVISIRRKSLLTTFKKQWTSKYIVIEGMNKVKLEVTCWPSKYPFDLNHNLGAGLSRKMTNFIMKAFINGRRVFGIPVKGFPKDYPSKMEYFFDPDVLTEGELAPNDRCCRICGKIGHFMKDCPMRRKVRRRRDQEDTPNQRYSESKEKRSKEDREIQNKCTEQEVLTKEDKPPQCVASKAKPSRAVVDLGREKILRTPVEKWKRQDDKDLREKRCFICGREGHIKKECPQFRGSPGSLSSKYMTQGKASVKRTQQES